jgi:hypothetical protein
MMILANVFEAYLPLVKGLGMGAMSTITILASFLHVLIKSFISRDLFSPLFNERKYRDQCGKMLF